MLIAVDPTADVPFYKPIRPAQIVVRHPEPSVMVDPNRPLTVRLPMPHLHSMRQITAPRMPVYLKRCNALQPGSRETSPIPMPLKVQRLPYHRQVLKHPIRLQGTRVQQRLVLGRPQPADISILRRTCSIGNLIL